VTPSWYGKPRYDCAFVVEDQKKEGFKGLSAVRIKLLFSFKFRGVIFPCALVHWFKKHGRTPDVKTGMWVVYPEYRGQFPYMTVIHLDTILRGAHLLPVFGDALVPLQFDYSDTLDAFSAFYVSRYADHHMNEIIF